MRRFSPRRLSVVIPLGSITLLALVIGCGSKDKKETTDTQNATDTSSSLSSAYPGTLALTVFPKTSTAALTEDAFDPNALPLKEKIAAQQEIVAGTASSCVPAALNKTIDATTDETCYEFDQDMIYGSNDTAQASARWLGTRNGKDAKGEACLVSFTRNQVAKVVSVVDQTLGFGMGALCQYKKDHSEVALPAIGDSIDLATSMGTLFKGKMTVTSATLERLEDVGENPLYRIIIKASLDKEGITRTIGVIHSPSNADNSEYSGTIYTVMEGVPTFMGGGQAPPSGGTQQVKYQLMSVTYQRTVAAGKTTLTAELRSAQIAKSLVSGAITSSGVLDLNVGTNIATKAVGAAGYGDYTSFTQANDAVDGITFVSFSLDPDTNEGTLAYWKNPGGNYYENARGFNISIGKNTTTALLDGCATSGSASINFTQGVSIRRYLNPAEAASKLTLAPQGFWHPFFNSANGSGTDSTGDFKTKTQQSGQATKWYLPVVGDTTLAGKFVSQSDGSLISRQCFAFNDTTKLYEIDATKTSTTAGFELVDTGVTSNSAKFIALPPPVAPPADDVFEKL